MCDHDNLVAVTTDLVSEGVVCRIGLLFHLIIKRCTSNRPFYRYGGHIELIQFKEYYRMPRGHEHISFVFRALFGTFFLKIIYRSFWTFFIAVPCRCGLRGGYIELVGFNDQLRSRVKTYLSARSCPSTIGQVRIMYVM